MQVELRWVTAFISQKKHRWIFCDAVCVYIYPLCESIWLAAILEFLLYIYIFQTQHQVSLRNCSKFSWLSSLCSMIRVLYPWLLPPQCRSAQVDKQRRSNTIGILHAQWQFAIGRIRTQGDEFARFSGRAVMLNDVDETNISIRENHELFVVFFVLAWDCFG